MIIANQIDLANLVGAVDHTEQAIGFAVYHGTECGAWVHFVHVGGAAVGVQLGSIVEGTDGEIVADTLYYPFSEEAWREAVQYVEQRADDLWHEIHDEAWMQEYKIRS